MEDLSRNTTRLRNITATEMAALFGLNPYSSPAKVLEQKLNPVAVVNNHVRRGKLREPSVLEAFQLDLGWQTERHESGTLELADSRIAATPDAYLRGRQAVVEAKSIMSRSFDKWYEAVPLNYHMQVHTQMLVTGLKEGYIGALEEGDPVDCEYRFVAWKIVPDETLIALMKQETTRFWEAVANNKTFRVNSAIKKTAIEILTTTSIRVYPVEDPIKISRTDEEKLSDIISLFQ